MTESLRQCVHTGHVKGQISPDLTPKLMRNRNVPETRQNSAYLCPQGLRTEAMGLHGAGWVMQDCIGDRPCFDGHLPILQPLFCLLLARLTGRPV